MDEIWKDIIGYEGLYQISNLGRVKSLPRKFYLKNGKIHKAQLSELILKDRFSVKGYKAVVLRKDLTPKSYQIHRLVAFAFIGQPDLDRNQINHINGIKTDNQVSNLEWVNNRENMVHSFLNKMSLPVGIRKIKEKYSARITVNRKEIHLGYHEKLENAIEARRNYQIQNLITNKYL
jgi:hypothetical protein